MVLLNGKFVNYNMISREWPKYSDNVSPKAETFANVFKNFKERGKVDELLRVAACQ